MAEQLPLNFAVPSEPIIASYNWNEFASSTGYQRFYLMGFEDATYALTTQTIYADYARVFSPYVVTVGGGAIDLNFDIQFKVPLTIEGNALISYTTYTQSATSNITVTVYLYHYDGSTETLIGSMDTTDTNLNGYARRTGKIACSKTHFGVGEYLRVTVTASNSAANQAWFYADPANLLSFTEVSTDRDIGSDFTVDIPFKIQQ